MFASTGVAIYDQRDRPRRGPSRRPQPHQRFRPYRSVALRNGTCSAVRILGGIRVRPAGMARRDDARGGARRVRRSLTLPAFATVTQPAAQIEVVDLTSGAVTLHRPLPPPEALCGRAILTMTSRSAGASAILAQIRSPVSRAVQSAPVSSLRYGGVDDRLVLWVAQAQRDRASALWPQHRSERDRVSSMRISDAVSSTAGSRR